jgi:hypothetical protein
METNVCAEWRERLATLGLAYLLLPHTCFVKFVTWLRTYSKTSAGSALQHYSARIKTQTNCQCLKTAKYMTNVGIQLDGTLPCWTGQPKLIFGKCAVRHTLWGAFALKMAVFWVVAQCRLAWVYRRFEGPSCLHQQGDVQDIRPYHPDDGGSTDLWNVGTLTAINTALQPRRQPSYSAVRSSSHAVCAVHGLNQVTEREREREREREVLSVPTTRLRRGESNKDWLSVVTWYTHKKPKGQWLTPGVTQAGSERTDWATAADQRTAPCSVNMSNTDLSAVQCFGNRVSVFGLFQLYWFL